MKARVTYFLYFLGVIIIAASLIWVLISNRNKNIDNVEPIYLDKLNIKTDDPQNAGKNEKP